MLKTTPGRLLLALLLAAGCTAAPEPDPAPKEAAASPYAGEQARPVKALSEADVEGYRTGQGMGLAKAAELNHYPGPKHVLPLAEELQLTDAQRAQTQQVFEAMRAAAVPLGEQIIAREGALDALFAAGTAEAQPVRALLDEIGALQAELRFVHLNAHLAMKALLSPAQVAHYDRLRGYTDGAAPLDHDPATMHH